MTEDPAGRVACETAATTGLVLVMGEISQAVRWTAQNRAYGAPHWYRRGHGLTIKCAVISSIDEQSPDIAMGGNASQGIEPPARIR